MPALTHLLESEETHPIVRRRALESAANSSHKTLIPYINQYFAQDELESKLSAVRAMGNFGDAKWLLQILPLFDSKSAQMRQVAARSAGRIGNKKAIKALSVLIEDMDSDVQLAAVYALGAIGGKSAHKVLVTVLEAEDLEHLHEAALEGVEEIQAFSQGLNAFLLENPNDGLDEFWDEEELEELAIDPRDEWDTFLLE